MKKWCFLLAALLLLPLSACGGIEDESYLRGRVAEVQRDSDGSPSALILDTGDGEREGVFWDEYTRVAVSQAVEEVLAGESFQALIPLGTELTVDLRPDAEGKPLTAQDGTELPDAGTADFLTVEEIQSQESLTLSDGTEAEIWVDFWGDRFYRLSDGTELLREFPQETDFSGYYVERDTSRTELPSALLDGITAYYQERGALYDIQEVVERAYQAYRQSEDPEEFSYFLVGQRVEWTATAPGVYYFRTTVTLPVREQEITEYQFTDAFDKETGEHIPNQDLFTVGQAEAIAAIVAGTQAIGQEAQAMEEYFQWPYLSFEPDELVVCYPAGALPGQEPTSIWGGGLQRTGGRAAPLGGARGAGTVKQGHSKPPPPELTSGGGGFSGAEKPLEIPQTMG